MAFPCQQGNLAQGGEWLLSVPHRAKKFHVPLKNIALLVFSGFLLHITKQISKEFIYIWPVHALMCVETRSEGAAQPVFRLYAVYHKRPYAGGHNEVVDLSRFGCSLIRTNSE